MLEHLLSVSATPGSTSRAEKKKRFKYTKQGEKSERDSEILNKRMRDRKIISCIPGTDTDAWEKIK